MPPRFTYWTIIFGGQPTSFRSGSREELLPTFKQIQARHPDAQLRYFARGKLWYSEEEAQAALLRERFEKRDRSRPRFGDRPRGPGGWKPPAENRKPPAEGREPDAGDRAQRPWPPRPPAGERRGADWRPGGDHKDPRDRFKVPRDVKRARFKERLKFRPKEDAEARGPRDEKTRAHEDEKRETGGQKAGGDTVRAFRPGGDQRREGWKPKGGGWKPKPAGWKPKGGGWRPKTEGRTPNAGDTGRAFRSGEPGRSNRKPGPGGGKPHDGGWKPKGGGWRPKTGDGGRGFRPDDRKPRPGGWKPRPPFKNPPFKKKKDKE